MTIQFRNGNIIRQRVIGLDGRPIGINHWFAADPAELRAALCAVRRIGRRIRIIKAYPQISVRAAVMGKGRVDPAFFGGIADGGEMASHLTSLPFAVRPDVAGDQKVNVPVGAVGDGARDDGRKASPAKHQGGNREQKP